MGKSRAACRRRRLACRGRSRRSAGAGAGAGSRARGCRIRGRRRTRPWTFCGRSAPAAASVSAKKVAACCCTSLLVRVDPSMTPRTGLCGRVHRRSTGRCRLQTPHRERRVPCLAEPRAGKGCLKFLSSRFTNVGIMRRAGACGQPFEVGQHATPAEGAILAVRWIEVQFTRRYWAGPVPAWRVGVALIAPAGESTVSPLHGLAPVALWFGRLA